jgi:hypothetical protein
MTPEMEPAAGPPGRPVLERRYQRLLAWYPPRHRAAHGDEMLGVLLAAASDGQRRPRLAEAANLLWGALLIWLRGRRAHEPAGEWGDALAVFSLTAPLVMLAWFAAAGLVPGFFIAGDGPGGWMAACLGCGALGAGLPFGLAGLRRTAAAVSVAATLVLVFQAGQLAGIYGAWLLAAPLLSCAAESVALLGSPGPARGWQALTRRHWIVIAVASAAVGVALAVAGTAWPAWGSLYLDPFSARPRLGGWIGLTAGAVVVLAVLVAAVIRRSAAGRRLLVLFAIPAWPWLVTTICFFPPSPVPAELIAYAPPLLLGAFVLAALRRERRARPDTSQASRA